jgi:hypothetical protein
MSTAFCLLAKTITNTKSKRSFKARFGTSPEVCSEVWERLQPHRPKGALPKHLLRALMFLKLYSSEDVLSDMVGTTRKTFRKWVWLMVKAISKIKAPSGKKLPTTFKTERKRGATTNMHLFRSFGKTG